MRIIQNFAVFEGGDGSGTTTQTRLLKERSAWEQKLRQERGLPALPPVRVSWEPTDGPVGRVLRASLKGEVPLLPETQARLFAADRNEHLYGPGGVAECCAGGELVVSDRYVLSSLVYQGLDCGEALPWALNRDFPGPELIIFFDLDAKTAMERIKARPGLDHYERLDFQEKVRERYLALLPDFERRGVKIVRVDASAPPEDCAEQVWSALQNLPIMNP